MRKDDLVVLGVAALAAWFLLRGRLPAFAGAAAGVSSDYALLVQEWQGWKYYSDGTAIGPDGTYYHKGEMVFAGAPATEYA